jgi:hypothetical protein
MRGDDVRWVKDNKVEANMRSLGIKFEVETVPFNKIDLHEGIRRQARLLGKLNDDYVVSLGVDMDKPDAAFPMCILQKPPRGTYWSWSGNHRLAAYRLVYGDSAAPIDAYIVCLSDAVMIDLFPRVVNSWESGIGFSREEKIANARWLVQKHNMPVKEAAALFGLKSEWLSRANRGAEIKTKLVESGVSCNGISNSVLVEMHKISDNLNVLKSTAAFLAKNKIKGNDAQQVIADVKRGNTELQCLSEIARWEKVIEERKAPKLKSERKVMTTLATRAQFIRNLTGLGKILARCTTLAQLQCLDKTDQEVIRRNWLNIKRVMDMIVE